MSEISTTGAGERVPLSQARIVAAALRFIDEQGLARLTMRRLGEVLEVEAMSLYRYVPGREALLDEVAAEVVRALEDDEEVLGAPRAGWQDYLQRLAHGVRRVALAHPEAFPLVASRPVEAPWLRPPLRSAAWVDRLLDALVSEGFGDVEAVEAYRAFTSFLLGHLLLEVADHGDDGGAASDREAPGLADHPTLRRLEPLLSQDRADVEFEEALEDLLQRLELLRGR